MTDWHEATADDVASAEQPCAGGIVFDEQRRLLVIERGGPPGVGLWSVPGGRCLPGELAHEACVRELGEETGLDVRVRRWVGAVRRRGPAGVVYLIDDFECEVIGGELRACDDARQARWVTLAELGELPLVPGLVSALSGWGLLPD